MKTPIAFMAVAIAITCQISSGLKLATKEKHQQTELCHSLNELIVDPESNEGENVASPNSPLSQEIRFFKYIMDALNRQSLRSDLSKLTASLKDKMDATLRDIVSICGAQHPASFLITAYLTKMEEIQNSNNRRSVQYDDNENNGEMDLQARHLNNIQITTDMGIDLETKRAAPTTMPLPALRVGNRRIGLGKPKPGKFSGSTMKSMTV